MKLTDAAIKAAKYSGSLQKLRDGNGTYLHVTAAGKYWRYDYRYQGKRKTLSIGVYPVVSLKQARFALFDARAVLDDGIDPSHQKQVRKNVSSDLSFSAVSAEWMKTKRWTDGHQRTVQLRLDKWLLPKIGHLSVKAIQAPDVLHVLRVIESRGAIETAHRVKTIASQVLRYSVAVGHIPSDPCRDLAGALQSPEVKPMAAIIEPAPFGKLLKSIDGYDQSPVIRCALQLLAHVVLRPGELRGGLWSEIDIEGRVWSISAERMKMKRPHVIPLTDQAIAIIETVRGFTRGSDLMFPSPRSKTRPISDGTMNAALRYLGYSGEVHVPHGFRSSFSTMAYESELWPEDVIEIQLAHADTNTVKGAYNRSERLQTRRDMMQWWSESIDTMRRS